MRARGFFLALILLPSLAVGQVTGSRIDRSIPRTDPSRVFAFMIDCYLKRYTPEAVRFLTLLPGSTEEAKRFANMTGALEVCLNSRDMVFEGNLLEASSSRYRRALAKMLVLSNVALLPDTLAPVSEPKPWFASRIADTKDFDGNALSVDEFGDCVARRDWATARALALVKPRSGDERRALTALMPSLGPCVSAGRTMKVEQEAIAQVVAEAVYRIAVAPVLEPRYVGTGSLIVVGEK